MDRIKQQYEKLKNPYNDQGSLQRDPENGPPKKKKKEETLGKSVKRGLKKGLEEGAKQWIDFETLHNAEGQESTMVSYTSHTVLRHNKTFLLELASRTQQ